MAIRNLQGKVVFITGAASGIGLATAVEFARTGCIVVGADIQVAKLEETRLAVEQAGGAFHAIPLDVSDAGEFDAVAADVQERIGLPHVLVNNAGIAAHGSFLNTPMEVSRRVIEVDLYGVVNGCRAFLPAMLAASDHRHLVNVASLASIVPMPNMWAYSAAKYAVDGLTEVLGMELEQTNVGVCCVHPGVINTPIVKGKSYNGAAGLESERRMADYYKSKGSDPGVVAAAIVSAVRTGRAHVHTGNGAAPSVLIKRLSPALMRRLAMSAAREIGFA